MRLVSLLPSATEIVYALGLGEDLAGVTFEFDDRYVRAELAPGRDLYTLRAQALAGLAPDLILTRDLCRVCALPSGRVNDALDYLRCHAAGQLAGDSRTGVTTG